MSNLFISHSSRDNAAAKKLQSILEEQGHRSVFLDLDPEVGIQAGVSWERTLYTKLRACRAVVALCSDSYLNSQWCFAEIALARMEGKELFALQIDPWGPKTQMPSILTEEQFIDIRTNQEEGYRRLWNGFKVKGIVPAERRDWHPDDPPYPGLRSFHEEDAPIFFGRDTEILEGTELLNQIRRQGHPRLAMVLGSSGSGKSSLVRAGIVPQLRRDKRQWTIVRPFRPGQQPMRELSAALSDAFDTAGQAMGWEEIYRWLQPEDEGELEHGVSEAPSEVDAVITPNEARQRLLQALSVLEGELSAAGDQMMSSVHNLKDYLNQQPADDTRSLSNVVKLEKNALVDIGMRLRLAGKFQNTTLVLVIDQFEELLGQDADHPASRFLAMLRTALDVENSPFLTIGTMRSDFLGLLQASIPLQGLGRKSLSVGPMAREGMRQIIEEPAKLGQIQIEDGLTDLLLDDTATADALPLLAFTLRIMWDRYRDDRLLEIREYKDLDRLQGAVALVAEETYQDALDRQPDDATRAAMARELHDAFLSMARPAAEGAGWSRQPVSWDELSEAVKPLLEPFIDPQRLLVKREDGTLEVAHETLFRSWIRLRGWLDENAEGLYLRNEIRGEAQKWDDADANSKAEYLWSGGRLARAQELRNGGVLALDKLDGSFIDASVRAEQAAAEAKEAARQRELAAQKQRRNIFAGAFVVSLALAIVAVIFYFQAENQRKLAVEQRKLVEKHRKMLLAEIHKKDPVLGRLIVREVPGRPKGLTAIATDMVNYRIPKVHWGKGTDKVDNVIAVAFGTEKRFAVGNTGNEVWVWEPGVAGDMNPRMVGEHQAKLWDVVFNLAGNTIASTDNDGIVKIWDAKNVVSPLRHELKHAEEGKALRVRLSKDGSVAAVLTEKGVGLQARRNVILWHLDGKTPRRDRVDSQNGDEVATALAVSPDGTQLLLGYRSGAVVLMSTEPGATKPVKLPADHKEEVRHVVFGESGIQMASADKAGAIWLQVQPGEERTLNMPWALPEPLTLRISQNRIFVIGENEVYFDELHNEDEARPFFPEFFHLNIQDADFDGTQFITALEGRDEVSIWDVDRAPEPRMLKVSYKDRADRKAMEVAYLDDDGLLVAYECGTVRLWSSLDPDKARNGRGPQPKRIYPPPHEPNWEADAEPLCAIPLTAMATSNDGQRYATAFRDGRIIVGDIHTGIQRAVPKIIRPQPIMPGRIDRTTRERRGKKSHSAENQNTIWSIAFDMTAKSLVVGLQDGRVRILDIEKESWADVGRHQGAVYKVDWAPGDNLLVSGSLDKVARVWVLSGNKYTGKFTNLNHESAVYTASFDQVGRRVVTGAEDFLVRVWNLASARPIHVELNGHTESVRAATFSPDGKWVLSGGGNSLGMSCPSLQTEGLTAPCERDYKMIQVLTPNTSSELGTVRAVAVSPTRPQFAAIDKSGELSLFRTDYRTALWQQLTDCLPEAKRRVLLGETPEQAKVRYAQCQAMVETCNESAHACEQALAKARF